MTTFKQLENRRGEHGNVLFLILIAVALFAALSYAVTQSSRSGGGNANRETNLVSSAQVTQYPASVRTSILRMIISDRISPANLEFNPPSAFGACTGGNKNCVFHPAGGGATFVPAPSEVVTGPVPQDWVFNGENQINLVGVTNGTNIAPTSVSASAEIIAFLPNVQQAICERINEELGIPFAPVPTETGINVTLQKINGVGLPDGAAGGTIGSTGVTSLDAQAFGCFQQPAGVYYYYHALIEQ